MDAIHSQVEAIERQRDELLAERDGYKQLCELQQVRLEYQEEALKELLFEAEYAWERFQQGQRGTISAQVLEKARTTIARARSGQEAIRNDNILVPLGQTETKE